MRSRLSGELSMSVPTSAGPSPAGGAYCTTTGPGRGSRPTRHQWRSMAPNVASGIRATSPESISAPALSRNHASLASRAVGRRTTPGFQATATESPSRIPRGRVADTSTSCPLPSGGGADSPAAVKAFSGPCFWPSTVIATDRSVDR